MPFISTGMATLVDGIDPSYVLFMKPMCARALLDFIVHKGWDKIHYVYDTVDGKS